MRRSVRIRNGGVLLTVLTAAAAAWASGKTEETSPAAVDKPLVAWWSFDEGLGADCRDRSGAGNHASASGGAAALRRTMGLFGNAMGFSGRHRLAVAGRPDFATVRRIALSAWVRPVRFERYNEIFRKEDGDRRVLFSFQEHAKVLALGLNVGGYVECDAPLLPAQVLDGQWHHCAATFDGREMRVYLDGRQIGLLARRGEIRAGGPAPGCIGSMNGGECFQGAIDELRIYREALTAEEVARLWRDGAAVLSRRDKQHAAKLAEFYVEGETFAESLAGTRRNVVERRIRLTPALAGALRRKLRTSFQAPYDGFLEWTGTDPLAYLTAVGADVNERLAARLMGELLEYKPLTDAQWRRLTPEQLRRWKDVQALERRYERLRAAGEAARHSPEWVELVLQAGPRIHRRPHVREAVAPYVTPATPETRDRTADEAREVLERDWLHQADGKPTPERIAREIDWARELADRLAAHGGVDLSRERAELDDLARLAAEGKQPDPALYFRVRAVKRRIALANPVLDFDKVLFVDMPYPGGSEWRHETRHRLGYMAVPGARLLVLRGLSPGGHLTQLMPKPPLHGAFWRPDVSYDGRKVLFCFKPHNEKAFHLYEIDADGGHLAQLTAGPYDDLDPVYLPDGEHILFTTTRGHTYVRCMPPTNAYVLARCRRDGRDVYLISRGNEPDYTPSVLNDGRVVYTRWEYTDKPLWRAQGLWTANPDGTAVATLWGNQSVWPDLLKDARAIPGSRRILFTGSAHHNWFGGSVGLIDPDRGFNFPDGLTKVTADVAWPECGNGPADPVESPRYHASGRYAGYYAPYPLSETDFLVSADRGGKFVLYLMDVDGNRELIYEGTHNVLHAMPLRPRHRPPVVPDRVDWPTRAEREHPRGGVIYSADVCQGAPPELRGRARYLRVLNIEHKTYTYWHKRPYISTGPVVSAVQSEGVKRIVGTVPIGPDGSVAFHAPSGIPLHFQLLDGRFRALQTMRSFTGVMPGEKRGCLGCHELHSTTPVAAPPPAGYQAPSEITPPPWDDRTVSWDRYVKPVLARYCGACHQGTGKAVQTLDMTPRPGFRMFQEPYVLFTGRPAWGRPYSQPKDPPPGWGIAGMIMVEGYHQRDPAAYRTPPPMTRLSYRSRLIDIASSGRHHEVKVDPVSLRRLICWVDAMCPYRGAEEVRAIPDPDFQGVDWLSVRPRIATAPRVTRPGPVD